MVQRLKLIDIPGYGEFLTVAYAYDRNTGYVLYRRLNHNPLEIIAGEEPLTIGVRTEQAEFKEFGTNHLFTFFAKTGNILGVNLPNGSELGLEARTDKGFALVWVPLVYRQGMTLHEMARQPVKIMYNP